MRSASGGRQWFRHLVYRFFDASQGDAVPKLEPMLAPRNFRTLNEQVLHGVGKSRSLGRPSSEPGSVEVDQEKCLGVEKGSKGSQVRIESTRPDYKPDSAIREVGGRALQDYSELGVRRSSRCHRRKPRMASPEYLTRYLESEV